MRVIIVTPENLENIQAVCPTAPTQYIESLTKSRYQWYFIVDYYPSPQEFAKQDPWMAFPEHRFIKKRFIFDRDEVWTDFTPLFYPDEDLPPVPYKD